MTDPRVKAAARAMCKAAGHDPDGGPKWGFGWLNYEKEAQALIDELEKLPQSRSDEIIRRIRDLGTWDGAIDDLFDWIILGYTEDGQAKRITNPRFKPFPTFEKDQQAFKIGDKVRIVPETMDHPNEWRRDAERDFYIAAAKITNHGRIDYTISDSWPVRWPGWGLGSSELTDGLYEHNLKEAR